MTMKLIYWKCLGSAGTTFGDNRQGEMQGGEEGCGEGEDVAARFVGLGIRIAGKLEGDLEEEIDRHQK